MAKSSNTWCKKLMAKGKKHALGVKLGTFKPHSLTTSQDAAEAIKKTREFFAPVKTSYVPKRRGSGSRLSPLIRAQVNARHEARREFFAAIGVRV